MAKSKEWQNFIRLVKNEGNFPMLAQNCHRWVREEQERAKINHNKPRATNVREMITYFSIYHFFHNLLKFYGKIFGVMEIYYYLCTR